MTSIPRANGAPKSLLPRQRNLRGRRRIGPRMPTPIRAAGPRSLVPTVDDPVVAQSTTPRPVTTEPSVVLDSSPGIPAYLRRENAAATVPMTCVEASTLSAAQLASAHQAADVEIRSLEGLQLDAVDQQLQALQHENRGCSRDAQIALSLPNAGRTTVAVASLESLSRAVREQRGWNTVLDAIRSSTPAQLSQLAAALQRAAQARTASGTSVEVALPPCRRIVLAPDDLAVISRVCDAQARLQQRRHEQSEIEASNGRGEGWRAAASMTMVPGTALAVGECVTGQAITGRPISGAECAFMLLGAAVSWAGAAYLFASRVMRTESLALAALNANVRLRDIARAATRLSEADRQTLREIYNSMHSGRPGELIELSAHQEATVREILQRAGVPADGPMGALAAGRRYRQLLEAQNPGLLRTEFSHPVGAEVHETGWVDRAVQGGRERMPAGNGELTSDGHIIASVRGTFTDRMRALFHERVHRLFLARVEGSPMRQQIAAWLNARMGQLRSGQEVSAQIVRYLHESLAEAITQLRVGNANWLQEGLRFPLNGHYAINVGAIGSSLRRVVEGSALVLGVVTLRSDAAEISIGPYDAEIEAMGTPYRSELQALARTRTQSAEVERIVNERNSRKFP